MYLAPVYFQQIIGAVIVFSAACNQDKCNSAIVVVMSYGTSGHVLGSDLKYVERAKIEKHLNGNHCPELKDKPKVFLYQVCRVRKYTPKSEVYYHGFVSILT